MMSDNEIEEKLRRLTPKQLLELTEELSRSDSLADDRRHELREVSLRLMDEIRQNGKAAENLLREKGRQLLDLADRLRKDDTLTYEQRQEFDRIASMIAGYLMSSWLPRTLIRKILMFLFLAVGFIGVVQWSLWFGLFIILGAAGSPRIVGEVLYFIGTLYRNQRK
jgi:hypothetical protein